MASNSRVPDPSSTRFGLEPMRDQPQNIWHIVSATCRSLFPRIVFGIMPWNPVKFLFVGDSATCRSQILSLHDALPISFPPTGLLVDLIHIGEYAVYQDLAIP